MIYVTLGTMYKNFDRLVHAIDEVAAATQERVVMQTGMSTIQPKYCECFDFKPHEEILALEEEARLIVCHGGAGSMMEALRLKKPLIVVPRLKRFGEHNNDHQMELARAAESRGWGRCIVDIEELAEACANPPEVCMNYAPAIAPLVAHIRGKLLS